VQVTTRREFPVGDAADVAQDFDVVMRVNLANSPEPDELFNGFFATSGISSR